MLPLLGGVLPPFRGNHAHIVCALNVPPHIVHLINMLISVFLTVFTATGHVFNFIMLIHDLRDDEGIVPYI